MSRIKVDTEIFGRESRIFDGYGQDLLSIEEAIGYVRRGLPVEFFRAGGNAGALLFCQNKAGEIGTRLQRCSHFLQEAACFYEHQEQRMEEQVPQLWLVHHGTLAEPGSDGTNRSGELWGNGVLSLLGWQMVEGSESKQKVINAKKGAADGYTSFSDAAAALFSGQLQSQAWNAQLLRRVENYLLRLSLSVKNEWIAAGMTATAGDVILTGRAGVTLVNRGTFSPSLNVEAKAEGAVLKGDTHLSLGNTSTNVHVKANGALLSASAEGSMGIGVITVRDPSGITITAPGIEAKGGAEAYLAEGTLTGGITILGVRIDAGMTGKAGGAGAKMGGYVTAESMAGEVSVGLGIGMGITLCIDWSGFDWMDLFSWIL